MDLQGILMRFSLRIGAVQRQEFDAKTGSRHVNLAIGIYHPAWPDRF